MHKIVHQNINRKAVSIYFSKTSNILKHFILLFIMIILLPESIYFFSFLILSDMIRIFIKWLRFKYYKQKVDEIIDKDCKYLEDRGLEKLNLIPQQISLINPFSTVGPSSLADAMTDWQSNRIINGLKILSSTITILCTFIDSFLMSKQHRYTIVEINCFYFGDYALHIYFAHLDLRTGAIFHEGTEEYYYKDITSITTKQADYGTLSISPKISAHKGIEEIIIHLPGSEYNAVFYNSISGAVIDRQFVAMRNLVRHKKYSP